MAESIKKLDEKFEEFLNKINFDQIETELTPELRKLRRAKADADDFEFCKIYFPMIFNDEWNALHRHIKSLVFGNHNVSGSRFYGKSAFTLMGKLIKRIAIGGIGLVGLGMRTQEDAKERGDALTRIIKRNTMLCYDYDIQFQQDLKGYWIINNKTFVTVGVKEGLRNLLDENFKRFELLILDDLYNRTTVSSEKDNDKVYDFVTSEVYGQMNADGLSIWLFNIIIEDSPGDKISKEFPQFTFNLPAWDDNEETNWPESHTVTKKWLHDKCSSMSLQVWAGDWLNQPIQIGEVFEDYWIRSFNINKIKIKTSLTAIDPSFGKSPSACFKGAITLGLTDDNQPRILDVYLRKEDYEQVFDYIDNIRFTMPAWKVLLFENDFSQWEIAQPYYKQWCEKRNSSLPIFTISTKQLKTEHYGSDKAGRIMNLVYPHQRGEILYNEDILNNADFKLYKSQLLSFGKSKQKLDGPDAAATAYIMIKRYTKYGSFKATGKRNSKDKLFRRIQ